MRYTKKLFFTITLTLLVGITHANYYSDMSREAIEKRIQPIGKVNIEGEAVATPTEEPLVKKAVAKKRTGKDIYQKHCVLCHGPGLAGAPKYRDKTTWASHVKKGKETMLNNAVNGLNAMPPMGTCADCTKDELKVAIEYMLPQ